MQNNSNENQLIYMWKRNDWRESIFAPQFSIIQALTIDGSTASGAGDNRQDALARCLSETAEILAVGALQRDNENAGTTNRPLNGQDGTASHLNHEQARLNAFYEAHERVAISKWWLGGINAMRVPDEWLGRHGYANWIMEQRASAAIKRVTGLWLLEQQSNIHIVICRSQYANEQDPVLGFGASACAFEAIEKALRENMLMEINLIEVLASRSGYSSQDMSRVEAKVAGYATRCPLILTAVPATLPEQRNTAVTIERFAADTAAKPEFCDITPANCDRPVWRCHLPGHRDFLPGGRGSPFM